MALFFDASWFDARLAQRGLDRDALAAAAGLSVDDLTLVFKDQREVRPAEVRAFSEVLGVDMLETAQRCGTSTRLPESADPGARIDDIETRLDAVEKWINEFEAQRDKARGDAA